MTDLAVGPGQVRPLALPRRWIAVADGRALRQARAARGLSREKLAYAAGVSVTTVTRLETQPRCRCHIRTLGLLAKALGQPSASLTAAQPAGPGGAGDRAARPLPGTNAARASWSCTRTFPASAEQVPVAREFLRRVLDGCPASADAVLICSELAANAVTHSLSALPGGWFTIRVQVRDGDYVFVEVEDLGGRWAQGGRSDQHGRGLLLVDALADYWDIRGDDTGRIVCARLDWPGQDTDS